MKYCDTFEKRIGCSTTDEVFSYLMKTLRSSVTGGDYFVNWVKVFQNVRSIEIDLNLLNYLIGKENIKAELFNLLKEHPSLIQTLPILIACREKEFELHSCVSGIFQSKCFSFSKILTVSEADIQEIIEFSNAVGLLKLFEDKKIKNLVDYVIGVEVGLDSNGRKNRGGTTMENIVESFVSDICNRNKFEYIPQATSSKLMAKWKKKLTVDKSSRSIDFAVFNGKKIYLLETNCYGGGGSKLKATAGEYKSMYDYWKQDGHGFIWITDGAGWNTARLPLLETFNYTDYILNLEMVSKKILEDILVNNL